MEDICANAGETSQVDREGQRMIFPGINPRLFFSTFPNGHFLVITKGALRTPITYDNQSHPSIHKASLIIKTGLGLIWSTSNELRWGWPKRLNSDHILTLFWLHSDVKGGEGQDTVPIWQRRWGQKHFGQCTNTPTTFQQGISLYWLSKSPNNTNNTKKVKTDGTKDASCAKGNPETIINQTWYLSFFYTTEIWGQEISHLTERRFATKVDCW